MEYIELGQACIDCTLAIANGDTDTLSDKRAAEVWASIEAVDGYLVIGDEIGFSWQGCDVCGSHLGGDMHAVGYLKESAEVAV
jgi:hypothetical protein